MVSLETCPKCNEKFIPIWENQEVKCKKCKSKIRAKNLGEIKQEKFEDWDNEKLLELISNLTARLESIYEEYEELKNRIETLGIIVEQNR